MMFLSALPEARVLPSGLKATLFTLSLWPMRGEPICVGEAGLATSHRITVLSTLPEANILALAIGLKATLFTPSLWPMRGEPICVGEAGLATSHRIMVLSAPPEAK